MLILASAGNIYANTNSTDAGSCSFNGKEMVSSFDSNKLAVSVSEMEPGDTVDFRVAVKMTVIYLQTGIWQMTL